MMEPLTSLLAVFSGLFCMIGLFALGSWAIAFSKRDTQDLHFRVVIGLGVFYMFFYTLSWVLLASWVWHGSWLLLLVSICTQFRQLAKVRLGVPDLFFGLLVLVFMPYFFRLFSPPVSEDGLSFYLPNIAWIHAYGLTFNPYLTNYTTMPLGIEYLFSIPFGFAGHRGVVVMDAMGTLALVHLLYQFSQKHLSRTKSQLFVVATLLIKGTFFFVFASGKIDTWNTYVFMTGLFLFSEAAQKRDWQGAFLVFSIALGLKFTNYILLLLPLIVCWFLVFKNQGFGKAIILAFVPLFFVGSVLVRNYVLVNNPFAPLVQLDGQSRFVAIHQDEGTASETLRSIGELWDVDKVSALIQLVVRHSQYFLVVIFIVLGWFFWKKRSSMVMELRWAGVVIVLMYIPWLLLLGNTIQPLRFIWAPLMLIIWAALLWIDSWEKKSSSSGSKRLGLILFSLCSTILITTVYLKHFHYIPDFFAQRNRTTANWYSHVGRDHYAFSYRFKELGLHRAKVNYRMPVALGAFSIGDYGSIPTQEEFYLSKEDSKEVEYILDFGNHKLIGIPAEKIVLQSGEYFVYRN